MSDTSGATAAGAAPATTAASVTPATDRKDEKSVGIPGIRNHVPVPAAHASSPTKQVKYVLVTGGVVSGLGKGITCSSIGLLLQHTFKQNVTALKIDPYLNCDAGTMSPFEHGECFVLADGGEVDLDLGNYERFLGIQLTRDHNVTSGKIYKDVLDGERQGKYLGKTVQMVPHVTDRIEQWFKEIAVKPIRTIQHPDPVTPDLCMIEMGGTVGDIENQLFTEALRRLKHKLPPHSFFHVHVSLIPNMGTVSASTAVDGIASMPSGAQKTKPTQQGLLKLRELGLNPDMVICRSSRALTASTIDKLSNMAMIPSANIVAALDVKNIYEVPECLAKQNVHTIIGAALQLVSASSASNASHATLPKWLTTINAFRNVQCCDLVVSTRVHVAICGKYTDDQDSYLSLIHALQHAALALNRQVEIHWIDTGHVDFTHPFTCYDTEHFYKTEWYKLCQLNLHAIVIPGGFGDRGIPGMIQIAKFARENAIPFLGICLGMQVAMIEIARHVLNLSDAHSEEFDIKTPYPVFLKHEPLLYNCGGPVTPNAVPKILSNSMKVGAHDVSIHKESQLLGRYRANPNIEGSLIVRERFRHRYGFNTAYRDKFQDAGFMLPITKPNAPVQMFEATTTTHPFFVGVQFHPEYQTYPDQPAPAFYALIAAAIKEHGLDRFGFIRRDAIPIQQASKSVRAIINPNAYSSEDDENDALDAMADTTWMDMHGSDD